MKNALMVTVASAALLAAGAPAFANTDGETSSEDFVLPSYGTINPFYGTINPFYGHINPFYGHISPFWGDISPFWGDINPFYGDIAAFWGDISAFEASSDWGEINAFWGDISAFWGHIGPFWGDINAFWGDIDAFSEDEYSLLKSKLDDLFGQAEAVFGPAIEAQSGTDFQAFLDSLLDRFEIDTSDPQSLAELTAEQRAAFFLAFYDGLMSYSGRDHVDHWMPAIGWSPALAARTGGGAGVTVGVVDFSTPYRLDGLRGSTGGEYLNVNHGLAVASLISADINGQGVMGVAPDVAIRLANPFDDTLTASWQSVADAVEDVGRQVDIINLSLGVPNWTFHPQWEDVFSTDTLRRRGDDILFVFAAGNDGVTQSQDIDWTRVGGVENLIIVGSVNPAGEISSFSNRPGEACLTVSGTCPEGHRLMDRFIVAPGELILVPDGEGGLVRMSGTSFAAPLVAGAAALVKGHWNWLEPGDVATVLLETARDLGAPGVDPVYGRGMLDIDAAFQPFDLDNLYHVDVNNGRIRSREFGFVDRGVLANIQNGQVVLFEDFRGTFRDFEIDVVDVTMQRDGAGGQSDYEVYLSDRASRGPASRGHSAHFTDSPLVEGVLSRSGSTLVRVSATPLDAGRRAGEGGMMFQAGLEITDTVTGRTVRFGHGEGAMAFSQSAAFGLASDHRAGSGGVNPVLGLASGGAYLTGGFAVSERTSVSVAVTQSRDPYEFVNPMTGEPTPVFSSLNAYSAAAVAASVNHALSGAVSVNMSYTRLSEPDGLLGAQGLGAFAFHGGSVTDAATFGAQAELPYALTIAGSATIGRTHANLSDRSVLALDEDIVSTAFQVSLRRDGVFGARDAVRASLIQPLNAETGMIAYTGAIVSDRQTGELSMQTQQWALRGERRLAAELLYAAPLFGERAGLDLFARVEAPEARFLADRTIVAGGARFQIEF
ncbi:MAG: S8 family serine peptidase [Oceanicaulis sp.]|nr:S8 family serine peptidase [Oceanicaulis sp.]